MNANGLIAEQKPIANLAEQVIAEYKDTAFERSARQNEVVQVEIAELAKVGD